MSAETKEQALLNCMSTVENVRRDFQGQPDVRRTKVWEAIAAMLAEVVELAKKHNTDISVQVAAKETEFLFGVSRTAATSAVNAKRADLLEYGLAALAMENMRDDYRHTVIELHLLEHSASLLGTSLSVATEKIDSLCSREFRELCQGFLSHQGHSLDAIGYTEVRDQNGVFTYRQAW